MKKSVTFVLFALFLLLALRYAHAEGDGGWAVGEVECQRKGDASAGSDFKKLLRAFDYSCTKAKEQLVEDAQNGECWKSFGDGSTFKNYKFLGCARSQEELDKLLKL